MAKMGPGFDPAAYAPVAERIRLFYERHPLGRIETELVSRSENEIIFKAIVYRDAADKQPAATGWAAEREGDGEINLVACLENTETSAIGRALANLGFTASRERPSIEEMTRAGARVFGSAFPPRGAADTKPRSSRVGPSRTLCPRSTTIRFNSGQTSWRMRSRF